MIDFLSFWGGVAVCVFIYGHSIRPWITRQRFFNSSQDITSNKPLIIRVDCDSRRVVDIVHEVYKGDPVTIVVASAHDIDVGNSLCMHIPAAASFSSLYGKRQVVLPEGKWAVMVTPHSSADEVSRVRVEVSIAHRPFLVPESECNLLYLHSLAGSPTDEVTVDELSLSADPEESTAIPA